MPDYDDYDDYDGPPAWWAARCRRAAARQPECDECGTLMDEDADDGGEE